MLCSIDNLNKFFDSLQYGLACQSPFVNFGFTDITYRLTPSQGRIYTRLVVTSCVNPAMKFGFKRNNRLVVREDGSILGVVFYRICKQMYFDFVECYYEAAIVYLRYKARTSQFRRYFIDLFEIKEEEALKLEED